MKPFRLEPRMRRMIRSALCAALVISAAGPWASTSRAQGSRKDDVVFNSRGQPLAGALIRVCTSSATTTSPCTPTATVYSDVALTQALANPFTTDGMGNYNFYAAPGRYVIEISGPGITTHQLRDVILPSDPSQPLSLGGGITTSGDISAFTLSLAGNLTVAGSTAITGTLPVGGAPVPSTTGANTWTASQTFQGPSPWRDVRAYGAVGNGSTDDGPAFNAAITAAEADPGGTVYVSWSAHPYLLNTCPAFASSHASWLTIVFAGNVTLGSVCSTINLHTNLVELRGLGSGTQQAFDRGAAKASIFSNNANVPLFDVQGESIVFRNLDLRCNAGSTGPCVNWNNNGAGSSVYIDSIDTNITNSGTGPALQMTGLSNPGGFGGRITGGTIASATSCGASIKIINWGMVYLKNVFIDNCGIYLQYLHPSSAPVSNIRIVQTLMESGATPFVTLDADTVSGTGINGVEIDDCVPADQVGSNAYVLKTLGTNSIANVTLSNCGGGAPQNVNQSANPILGLFITNLPSFTSNPLESGLWSSGSLGHLFTPPYQHFWGPAATSVAGGTLRGGWSICQGAAPPNQTPPLQVVDCTNGGNGITLASLPGGTFASTSSLVTREDSAATSGYHTLESPNNGTFSFMFCRPTGGCPGSIFYNHPNGGMGITVENQAELYIGDAFGGLSVRRGMNFLNSGSYALTFGGSFTAARSQTFQDATGTISLTSQLPLSGTTSSIGGGSLAAGACTSGTTSITGSATSMTADSSPATDPGAGFTWNAFVSAAGTVTVRVCNVSGATATPTASAYNVRVIQ